jgi:uroporphyrinogen decarboxylase
MTQEAVKWKPLAREEVIKAVEGKGPSRVPLVWAKWWGEELEKQYGARLKELDRYPEDIGRLWIHPLMDFHKMTLSWDIPESKAHDSVVVIDDWAKLDEFIERFPDPEKDPRMDELVGQAENLRKQDYYIMFGWWNLFFERPWMIRGMENLLMDYIAETENLHRLHSALCDLYCGYIRRATREIKPDGFWTSDDLGHQTQPMMSPEMFDDLIKPYYKRVSHVLKEGNMHFWLHSCGNNTPLLPFLIEAGVDVFHPVQKGTMDEVAVVKEFGDRLCFLSGIDVQHILQEKDPPGVREEVRHLIDTFDQPEGKMCIAAGNGIVRGTPFENIEAFLDEALRYGEKHRQEFNKSR